ncbi:MULTISPECIES: DUF1127 domain-containing protein [unclassified Rhizobium]|uniref:DUF1127 domain-containing protein n=1 Tax=unclassified Rhizobium TaxID=2613769 RepID=UPI0006FF094F|nr:MULTISPECIES: DUF1127 domain-containing protein [unclassified Rhizobium]KQV43789.1 hypothetical protein ASC86_03015 [Rhizobium sp. Root1212]KRD37973.1 hypothetical protein ASE37_03015 [Rhizobium sp. Root268]
MRATDYALGPDLAGKAATASRRNGLVVLVAMVWRALRNRNALMRLDELDDRRLLDLGLCREDVRSAITSTLLEDTGAYLTKAARARTRGYYREALDKAQSEA